VKIIKNYQFTHDIYFLFCSFYFFLDFYKKGCEALDFAFVIMGSPLLMATATIPHIKAWNGVNPTPVLMGLARLSGLMCGVARDWLEVKDLTSLSALMCWLARSWLEVNDLTSLSALMCWLARGWLEVKELTCAGGKEAGVEHFLGCDP